MCASTLCVNDRFKHDFLSSAISKFHPIFFCHQEPDLYHFQEQEERKRKRQKRVEDNMKQGEIGGEEEEGIESSRSGMRRKSVRRGKRRKRRRNRKGRRGRRKK